MIIVTCKYLPKNVIGLTILPFIFVKTKYHKSDKRLINHEMIHIRQQMELLFFIFFIWYGIEWLCLYFKYKNSNIAYRNISFEREAYENENNENYNKEKSLFSFLKYYNKKYEYR